MVSVIPNEILRRIIECAALQDTIHDNLHTYETGVLTTLCRVSKLFYAFAAPLIYHDIIVHIRYPLRDLLPMLIPLLSREQRHKLRNSTPRKYDRLLADQERIVSPLWVRRLSLINLGSGGGSAADKALLWQYIEETAQDMENLRFICWEKGKYHSPRLAQRLSKLQRLSHIICGNTDDLHPLGHEPWLIPLNSITVYYFTGFGEKATSPSSSESLHGILQTSYRSLRVLQLFYQFVEADSFISKVFADPHKSIILPSVEDLLLTEYGENTIKILTKVIDFSRLKSLQLVKYNEAGGLPQALGKSSLRALQRLSVSTVPSSAVDVLNRCRDLQEIHIVYQDNDPQKVSNPTWGVLEAVLKHGSTLRELTLNGTFCGYPPITADGFAKLASRCPKLEDLKVNPDFHDWNLILVEIAKIQTLKHLCFDMMSNPSIEGKHVLTRDIEPWWDEAYKYHPEGQLSEFDKAIGQLLEASVSHAVSQHNTGTRQSRDISWRDYSKLQYVKISAKDAFPMSRKAQGYLLREGGPMDGFKKDYCSGHHCALPPGHLYSYNAHGISISLRVMGFNPKSIRMFNHRPPAGWETAFKAPSDASRLRLDFMVTRD